MHRHLATVAMIATALVLTGCHFIDTVRRDIAAAPVSTTHANTGPALLITRGESPEQHRLEELVHTGFETLPAEGVGYYMDVQEARLRQEFANTDIVINRQRDSITLVVPGSAMFETNSTRLNPTILTSLDGIARVLTEYRKTLVAVEGYTDNVGSRDYNQSLSEQRALAVGHYLAHKGIGTERLIVVGYGEKQPLASNASEEGRARNRRVELTLYPLTVASR